MTEAPTTQAPTLTAPTTEAPSPSSALSIDEVENEFLGADGTELVARRWAAVGTPRAAVAIVHGLGEHSGRYGNVVRPLTAAGYAVHGFDLRGHGRSGGKRGHIGAWSEYREDIDSYLGSVRIHESTGAPVFLYGHSLGGAMVLEWGLRRQEGVDGVVASSPALRPRGVRSPLLERLAGVMSRIWPSFSLDVPLENEALSRDPERVEAARKDPLNHRRLSARATVATLEALTWTEAHAGEWRLPLLIFHGTADRIIDPTGTVAFAEAARAGGATDVELHLYAGVYHEPHNDLDAAAVEADVVAWLARHLPAASGSTSEGSP